MELDFRQTRSLHLAGTVAFPTPFPTAGQLWFEDGKLTYPTATRPTTFVIVHESSSLEYTTTRAALKTDVAAIFFPGYWEDTDKGRVFHFSESNCVHDLEKGEWFLDPDVEVETISRKLQIDVTSRDSGARGIMFVPEMKPVYSRDESVLTAGGAQMTRSGCDPHRP